MLDYLLSSNFGTDMLWFMELLFAVHADISTDIAHVRYMSYHLVI